MPIITEIPASWFFSDWQTLLKTLVVGLIGYVFLVILLRVSGKRTLSKLNAFDLVVTIAFGSVMATSFLSSTISVAQVVLTYGILIYMQYLLTYLSVRTKKFQRLIKSSPTLLYYRGHYLEKALRGERMAKAELRSAVRQHGISRMDDVAAIVLEADGSLSIISELHETQNEALLGLDNADHILDNENLKNSPITVKEDT
ncbi:DUF421 domain-containing protein [Roseivirga sp. BDSF3-8]|uniref:DUF421 domain-containing protein n=1 Tax=Roseivirga sp. BDSF3-8 TaxID=3241598 RepID=UPI0035319099